MKMHHLTTLTLPELVELRGEIDNQIKRRALEQLPFLEKQLNEMRELAGLKRRPDPKLPAPPKRKPRLIEAAE